MITFIFFSDYHACMKKMDYRGTRIEIERLVRKLLKYYMQEIVAQAGMVVVEEVRRNYLFYVFLRVELPGFANELGVEVEGKKRKDLVLKFLA